MNLARLPLKVTNRETKESRRYFFRRKRSLALFIISDISPVNTANKK